MEFIYGSLPHPLLKNCSYIYIALLPRYALKKKYFSMAQPNPANITIPAAVESKYDIEGEIAR